MTVEEVIADIRKNVEEGNELISSALKRVDDYEEYLGQPLSSENKERLDLCRARIEVSAFECSCEVIVSVRLTDAYVDLVPVPLTAPQVQRGYPYAATESVGDELKHERVVLLLYACPCGMFCAELERCTCLVTSNFEVT